MALVPIAGYTEVPELGIGRAGSLVEPLATSSASAAVGLRSGTTASLAEMTPPDHIQGLRDEHTSHMVSRDTDTEPAAPVVPFAGSRWDMRLAHAEASSDTGFLVPWGFGCNNPSCRLHSLEADRKEELGTSSAVQSHHCRCVSSSFSFRLKSWHVTRRRPQLWFRCRCRQLFQEGQRFGAELPGTLLCVLHVLRLSSLEYRWLRLRRHCYSLLRLPRLLWTALQS